MCFPNLTEKTVTDDGFDRCSAADDPVALTEVGKNVFRSHMSTLDVLMTDDQRTNWVILWKDGLVFGSPWQIGVGESSTYTEYTCFINEWSKCGKPRCAW